MLKIIGIFLLSFIFWDISQACTVWGAITPEGVLVAKNRDFYPRNQEFRTVREPGKYAFFGLYAHNKRGDYVIKMAINETGLTAFITNAGSVPLAKRITAVPSHDIVEDILENFDNVDSINDKSSILFKGSGPKNYIFTDRHKALICEIGLNDEYKCQLYSREGNNQTPVTFAQTNHYFFLELKKHNLLPAVQQQTSYQRLSTINRLMHDNLSGLTLEKFIHFSFNTEAKNSSPLPKFEVGYNNTYQDNSIFRTFNSHPDIRNKNNPNSEQGVSSMVIDAPSDLNQPVKLYLRIINGVRDLGDENNTQDVDYIEAMTTLDEAIHHPDAIQYIPKVCRRDMHSTSCVPYTSRASRSK